jgi:hypothetical protein
MKRREDIYNLGNDYFQKAEVYFRTTSAEVEAVSGKSPVYSDGIYHYTQEPVYELSGGTSALNKRIFNVLPQKDWTPVDFEGADTFSAINDASAVFSKDYATGIVVDLNGGDTAKSDWSKTPGGKTDK